MNRLAVFARWPVPGEVKTRMGPALPEAMACQLYRAMLVDALSACEGAGADERLLYWADAPRERSSFPDPDGFVVRNQEGRDLGERLGAAFGATLVHARDRAVVIGADCPDLGPETIRDAFGALATHDLVLGPACDGGYFLIGLRRAAPALFEGIDWGTARVLEQTRERAEHQGWSVAMLPGLADLDTAGDLVRFVARCTRRGSAPGGNTAAALRAMGLLPDPA